MGLFKLLLTAIATALLLLKLGPISHLVDTASETAFSTANVIGLPTSLAVHAAGGLLVLITAIALAVYKPRGTTPYGLRKGREQYVAGTESDLLSGANIPRWVKIFGGIVVVLILLLFAMLPAGSHGPVADGS